MMPLFVDSETADLDALRIYLNTQPRSLGSRILGARGISQRTPQRQPVVGAHEHARGGAAELESGGGGDRLGGLIITEAIFNYPGMGVYFLKAGFGRV